MQVREGLTDHFLSACLDTPFNAICLKKIGTNIKTANPGLDFGLLARPCIDRGKIKSRDDLQRILSEMKEPFVTVRGHGWMGETPFVWSGTTVEFNAVWTID